MTKTVEEILKDLFSFIDDGCVEINFYGNDGFDKQEKVNGKELLKKYIRDAGQEYVSQFQLGLPTDEEIEKHFPSSIMPFVIIAFFGFCFFNDT